MKRCSSGVLVLIVGLITLTQPLSHGADAAREEQLKTVTRAVLKAHGFAEVAFVGTNHVKILSGSSPLDLNKEGVIAWARRAGDQYPCDAWALIRTVPGEIISVELVPLPTQFAGYILNGPWLPPRLPPCAHEEAIKIQQQIQQKLGIKAETGERGATAAGLDIMVASDSRSSSASAAALSSGCVSVFQLYVRRKSRWRPLRSVRSMR
jgi:hypothetical protein